METLEGAQEETHTSIQEGAHRLRETPASELTATKTGTSRNSLHIPLGHILYILDATGVPGPC